MSAGSAGSQHSSPRAKGKRWNCQYLPARESPPRFQIVAFQEYANRLTAYTRNEFSLDCLGGHQTHCPASTTMRGLTADHRHDTLLRKGIQNLTGAGSGPVIQSRLEPIPIVAMGQLTHGLRRQRNALRDLGRGDSRSQLPQSKCAQDDAHLLNFAPQQGAKFHLILCPQTNKDRSTCHTHRIAQVIQ